MNSKIENYEFYRWNGRIYFLRKDKLEGRVVIGNGVKSTGETYPYVSHIEDLSEEITDEEVDEIETLFENNLDLVLKSKEI